MTLVQKEAENEDVIVILSLITDIWGRAPPTTRKTSTHHRNHRPTSEPTAISSVSCLST